MSFILKILNDPSLNPASLAKIDIHELEDTYLK